MIKKCFIYGLLIIPIWLSATTPWQLRHTPVIGNPQAIGTYQNGCIIGGKKMPANNSYYQLTHPNDNRKYGHPELIDYLEKLAQKVHQSTHRLLLIGDMAMPAGGRFSSGHNSHQNGLDVDIWLQLPHTRLTVKSLSKLNPIYLTSTHGKQVNHWSPDLLMLFQFAASDERVARIFIHPAIKAKLCEQAGTNRQWLQKIRPWFGHRAHMHIRLRCPASSPNCISQEPPPAGDGCAEELASWLLDENRPNALPQSTPLAQPKQCQSLLDNNFKL